jgi:hypothetical protein
MCKKRKEDHENVSRKRNVFLNYRWDYIRQVKHKADKELQQLMIERAFVKNWSIMRHLHYATHALSLKLYQRRVMKEKKFKTTYIAYRLLYLFRKKIGRTGESFDIRIRERCRQSLTFKSQIVYKDNEEKAKGIILTYIRDIKWRHSLQLSCVHYWQQILKVRARFMHIIEMKRQRMDLLRNQWEKERKRLLAEYEKDYFNTKSKAAKQMIKKLRGLDFRKRDLTLKLYLIKCRTEHNIAFFEWRKNFKVEHNDLIEKYSLKLLECIEEEDKMLDDNDKEGKID